MAPIPSAAVVAKKKEIRGKQRQCWCTAQSAMSGGMTTPPSVRRPPVFFGSDARLIVSQLGRSHSKSSRILCGTQWARPGAIRYACACTRSPPLTCLMYDGDDRTTSITSPLLCALWRQRCTTRTYSLWRCVPGRAYILRRLSVHPTQQQRSSN